MSAWKSSKGFRLPKELLGKRSVLASVCFFVVVAIFVTSWLVWMQKSHMEKANQEIRESLGLYVMMLSKKDFETAKYFLTKNKESLDFLELLQAKMEIIKVTNLRLRTIYPAYVHENIGIVAFDLETTNEYTGKPEVITEFAIRFFVKEKEQWKIATPSDLNGMDRELLEVMLDEYKDYLMKYLHTGRGNVPDKETREINQKTLKSYKVNNILKS